MSDDESPAEKPDNQAVRAAKSAKSVKPKAKADKKPVNWKAAAGIGIGSAAVLAALLYANKARKKED